MNSISLACKIWLNQNIINFFYDSGGNDDGADDGKDIVVNDASLIWDADIVVKMEL